VEVVLYRRAAVRLFGSFVPASQVASRSSTRRAPPASWRPGNGSALDEGARVAAAALATRKGRAAPGGHHRQPPALPLDRNDLGLAGAGRRRPPARWSTSSRHQRRRLRVELAATTPTPGAARARPPRHRRGWSTGLGAADKHLPERVLGWCARCASITSRSSGSI
jgi:hypothetical protein